LTRQNHLAIQPTKSREIIFYAVSPTACVVYLAQWRFHNAISCIQRGQRMTPSYDRSALEASLSQLESTAIIFAQRSISDGKVREVYLRQTKKLSQEYCAAVATGKISAKDAATQVQLLRNEILEVQ
jgi:hypothetical protein